MHMIRDTTDTITLTPGMPGCRGKISVEPGADGSFEKRSAVLGTPNDMCQKIGKRLRHGWMVVNTLMERAFSPPAFPILSRGVAPGWDGDGPLALSGTALSRRTYRVDGLSPNVSLPTDPP